MNCKFFSAALSLFMVSTAIPAFASSPAIRKAVSKDVTLFVPSIVVMKASNLPFGVFVQLKPNNTFETLEYNESEAPYTCVGTYHIDSKCLALKVSSCKATVDTPKSGAGIDVPQDKTIRQVFLTKDSKSFLTFLEQSAVPYDMSGPFEESAPTLRVQIKMKLNGDVITEREGVAYAFNGALLDETKKVIQP